MSDKFRDAIDRTMGRVVRSGGMKPSEARERLTKIARQTERIHALGGGPRQDVQRVEAKQETDRHGITRTSKAVGLRTREVKVSVQPLEPSKSPNITEI